MKLLARIIIVLLPLQLLFPVDTFFIVQPCGWDEVKNRDFGNEFINTRDQILPYFEVLSDGFSVSKKDFIIQESGEKYQLTNDRFTIILKKKDYPLQLFEDKSSFRFKISDHSFLFILSNNTLEYSVRGNTINFPINKSNIAYAPNNLRIVKELGNSQYDDIIVNDLKYAIYLFGPIFLSDNVRTEYKMGDVLGTFQTSLWLSFESFQDDIKLFPIIVYDNEIGSSRL